MKNLIIISATALTATSGLILGTMQAASALSWNWNYSGTGIEASGTLTTNDIPNNLGFYLITGITGTRNGETIIGLQPTGTATPGNEPFLVDNLINLNSEQLTTSGFGYATSGGNFVNLFFASFLNPATYLEFFSAPPIGSDFEDVGPEDSESSVSFSATIVPEPNNTLSLLVLSALGIISLKKRHLK